MMINEIGKELEMLEYLINYCRWEGKVPVNIDEGANCIDKIKKSLAELDQLADGIREKMKEF